MKHYKFFISIIIVLGLVIACGKSKKVDTETEQSESKKEIVTEEEKKESSKTSVSIGLPYFLPDSVHVLLPVRLVQEGTDDFFGKLREEFSKLDSYVKGDNSGRDNIFSNEINNVVIYNRDSLTTEILLNEKRTLNIFSYYQPEGGSIKLIFSFKQVAETEMKHYTETLYMTSLDSLNINRISPEGVKIIGWKIFPDKDEMYIQFQEDSNKDGKFDAKDRVVTTRTKYSDPTIGAEIVPRTIENELNLLYR